MDLYEHLKQYEKSGFYGFHMPGHKRKSVTGCELPYGIDITEIDGFDDLHHPHGMIGEAEKRAASLYHADETHFLINGSTVGILSAMLGCTGRGDRILVGRNCHKSVYHAIELGGLKPVYLYPRYDETTGLNQEADPDDCRKIIEEYPDIRAAVLVSPTYDGVVSDIEKISRILHEKGIPLIVDEAHGAHFGFHPYFPANANAGGADVVIHSLHKTLPSLTQTALLHINGDLADRSQIRKYLRMLQSSSPSYVLMAAMDSCMTFLQKDGENAFARYAKQLQALRNRIGNLSHLRLAESRNYDRSKLVVLCDRAGISGAQLADILRKHYRLEPEMAAGHYVVLMTSVADEEEDFARLSGALEEIDRTVRVGDETVPYLPLPTAQEGRKNISQDYIYLYPPGIPVVVPGEEMTEEVLRYLTLQKELGCTIIGWE